MLTQAKDANGECSGAVALDVIEVTELEPDASFDDITIPAKGDVDDMEKGGPTICSQFRFALFHTVEDSADDG